MTSMASDKPSGMASEPEKSQRDPQWNGVERRVLGERRADILKAVYSRLDELFPPHVRPRSPRFLSVDDKNAALLMCLDILQRVKSIVFEPDQQSDFSPDSALVFGDQIAKLKEDGILSLMIDDEHPFGRPFEGFDGLMLRIQLMAAELAGNYSGISDRIPLTKGAIRFIKIPFPLGAFEKTTAVSDVMQAADEDALGFSEKFPGSHMSVVKCDVEEFEDGSGKIQKLQKWSQVRTFPRCAIPMNPNAQVLHYGSALFEGMNIERGADGKIDESFCFRLPDHWKRMNHGARILGMDAQIPFETFKKMVFETVQANEKYIPPSGKGRFYIRPNFFDAGPKMKVGNSHEYRLIFTAFPIGSMQSYHAGNEDEPNVFAYAPGRQRSVTHGMGESKAAGNYGGTIRDVEAAKKAGFKGLVYSDVRGRKVRESNATAVVFVKYARDASGNILPSGHAIIRPRTTDEDILDSITLNTVCEFAGDLGFKVARRNVYSNQLDDFDECLMIGTAAGITPVHRLASVRYDRDGVPRRDERYQEGKYAGEYDVNAAGDTEEIPKKMTGGDADSMPKKKYGLGPVGKALSDCLCAVKRGEIEKYRKKYLTVIPSVMKKAA